MKTVIRRILKGIGWLLTVVLVFFALWAGVDVIRVQRLKVKVFSIQKGATMDSVIALMGEPNATYLKGQVFFFSTNEHTTLAYGSAFEWHDAFHKEPPYFFPFKLNLFCPSSDDIVVILDDNDQVLEVKIPK